LLPQQELPSATYCPSRSCSRPNRAYRPACRAAHYLTASSLPSFPVVSVGPDSSFSWSSTVSMIPKPTATYFSTCKAFTGSLIGASSTTCTTWLIFLTIFFIFVLFCFTLCFGLRLNHILHHHKYLLFLHRGNDSLVKRHIGFFRIQDLIVIEILIVYLRVAHQQTARGIREVVADMDVDIAVVGHILELEHSLMKAWETLAVTTVHTT